MLCPDCNADVDPPMSACCEALTCTPSGGHFVCNLIKGHGGKKGTAGHDWRWRDKDGVLALTKSDQEKLNKATAKAEQAARDEKAKAEGRTGKIRR